MLPGMQVADPAVPPAVVRQETSLGAEEDLDFALQMLQAVQRGSLGPTLRVYRPRPTVALGQRDARLPGFEAAVQACRRHGFTPLVRKAGGRAAAYHGGCLILDHVEPQPDAMASSRTRFSRFGALLAGALREVGVPAGVGEIPGEYCPGEYTVYGGHPGGQRIKLAGTAQRVVSGAWLFSTVLVVEDPAPVRAVLTDCYAALGLEWNPATAGAVSDLVPAAGVDAVAAAVVAAYGADTRPKEGEFGLLRQIVARR